MPYAVLPKNAKPSKSASRDQTRPVLTAANLQQDRDGNWELAVTDSYQLARVKVEVKAPEDGVELTAGQIPADALKAAEKAGGFYANGTVAPCDSFGRKTGQTFERPDLGQYPNVEQLVPDYGAGAFAVGLDAELLHRLAQSLGATAKAARVKVTFFTADDGTPSGLRPFLIERIGGDGCSNGLLMPIRLDR